MSIPAEEYVKKIAFSHAEILDLAAGKMGETPKFVGSTFLNLESRYAP